MHESLHTHALDKFYAIEWQCVPERDLFYLNGGGGRSRVGSSVYSNQYSQHRAPTMRGV